MTGAPRPGATGSRREVEPMTEILRLTQYSSKAG
jgi:hypothetical protein